MKSQRIIKLLRIMKSYKILNHKSLQNLKILKIHEDPQVIERNQNKRL